MTSTSRASKQQNRFSREGFKPLPNQHSADNMGRDATIDIPLEQVNTADNSVSGLRNQSSTSALRPSDHTHNEKHSYFRGRRHKPEAVQRTGKMGYDGEEDTINTMGKIYRKILDFSIVTRYFLYVSPLAMLIAIPIIIGATAAPHATIAGVRILWFFTWIEIVWLSVWVSKIVAHYLPVLFQIFAGVVSSGVRKYSMVISALEIPLSLVGWAVTSLATFIPLMTCTDRGPPPPGSKHASCNSPAHWMDVVNKILGALVVASLLLLAEKCIIQLISINYHRKQFNARIKESKRNIYLLGLLYDASRNNFPMYCNEFAEEDYIIADQLNISRGLGLGSKSISHNRSGSATPMRLIQNVGRYGDKITSAFGNVAHEITGKEVFNPNSSHSIVVEALEKNRTAEALARRIWMSFVMEGRDNLYAEDITDVLGQERKEEAEEMFSALDRDGNGDISLDEMILTVTEFGRQRKSIASSMHDVDQAINVLDRMLAAVTLIIAILVFVAFLNKSFTTTLATTGTALLSLSFVFSVTCQEVLGSCIFLFVKHPFDIGDRVDVGASGAVTASQNQFVVEHISLLFTVFREVTGAECGRLCQIPNIVLNNLWIVNISRSKAMTEQFNLDISFNTTFDDIQILKNEMLNFILEKDNARDYQAALDVDVLGSSDQSKLTLMVEIKHKSNWSNESLRRSRRSKFMCALISTLKTVPIFPPGGGTDAAGSAANPNYAVTISDIEAKRFADKAAKSREDARLVPMKKLAQAKQTSISSGSPSGSPTRDNKAGPAGLSRNDGKIIDSITSHNPAVDAARDEAWTSSREDASTLGERMSIDRQDLEDVRGLLRRESTRGKRKPSSEYGSRAQVPSIPTIREPVPPAPQGINTNTSFADYAHPGTRVDLGYENQNPQRGPYSNASNRSPYRPQLRPQPTQYMSASSQVTGQPGPATTTTTTPTTDRGQAGGPQRTTSNPYRQQRSESIGRKPLSPTAGNGDMGDDEFENTRPYSGV